jgi:hypothetical protein
VVIECKKDAGSNGLQNVIIRMCRGIDYPVSIYVEGIAGAQFSRFTRKNLKKKMAHPNGRGIDGTV